MDDRDNPELMARCREPGVISEIRKGRLRLSGHMERLARRRRRRTVKKCLRIAQNEKQKCPFQS
jgi:hypothetical protein